MPNYSIFSHRHYMKVLVDNKNVVIWMDNANAVTTMINRLPFVSFANIPRNIFFFTLKS